MTRTRPLPTRKTLGTGVNVRPDTVRVRADALLVGQIILEAADHPAVITRIDTNRYGRVRIRARYIWSAHTERDWELGTFHPAALIDRAIRGEY